MQKSRVSPLFLLLSITFLCFAISVSATVTQPKIFADHMVLQQSSEVKFWGFAEAGESITVMGSWSEVSVEDTANEDGKWIVSLTTPKAEPDAISYEVTVSGTNTITYTDVLIGEVWVLSGQSNMQLPLVGWGDAPIAGSAQAIASANYPQLRLMVVGDRSASEPQEDITTFWDSRLRSWAVCTPTTVRNFSALGYFFGKNLSDNLNIPIGLIQCAWGGSSCEAWASPEDLERVTAYQGKGPWKPLDSSDNQTPSVVWNGMLKPIIPYSMRGVLWYQGETNMGRAKELSQLFPQMIEGWRREWGQGNFPFYFAQIAPWADYWPGQEPELWEAQASALFLENTGLVVTVDLVDEDEISNIHPKHKEPIGNRMALLARSQVYNEENLAYSGPLYRSMQIEEETIRLFFDHAESGLKALNEDLEWFEIAGVDGIFVPAIATIDENTIIVSSTDIEEPVQARYAWSRVASGDLYNLDGLPAAPFRTDPPDYLTSILGQVVRSHSLESSGLFVSHGRLFDSLGREFRGYGVNNLHSVYDGGNASVAFDALSQIREQSNSNIVRIVWSSNARGSIALSADHLDLIIQECLEQKMIPLVTLQDFVGSRDKNSLLAMASTWIQPEYLKVLKKHEEFLLVNIAGEWGLESSPEWRDAYIDAISIMRTHNGGSNVILVIDAALSGTDVSSILEYGQALLDHDPQHNLLFSLHLYDTWMDTDEIDRTFDLLKANQFPVIISGFGWSKNEVTEIPVEHIMERCVDLGFGYIAWVWSGDQSSSDLNLVDASDWQTITSWGELVISHEFGIENHARIFPALETIMEQESLPDEI